MRTPHNPLSNINTKSYEDFHIDNALAMRVQAAIRENPEFWLSLLEAFEVGGEDAAGGLAYTPESSMGMTP